MELNKFILDFASLFEETEVSEIKADTIFKDLAEWDSLIVLSFIALADEEYNVQIKGDDIRNSQTVEDLFNAIKNK